ncbi:MULTISPECIES: type II toxin-antitoxin system Phd/YefM family antitoxin [Streptosporangium]|uniref:Prevent-host-death family protein n=1 Tax=Streptosporangium brasiliense TaxID=47480 RepID=A0ABT9R0Q1_9ACTN|nr:type II toxin-antitoxin system prevent-host-death family antitoxin [Streptosporangium brasiliense]MDP9862794.1 prevent-host-death family protein [Streptosporangium brasiliense]
MSQQLHSKPTVAVRDLAHKTSQVLARVKAGETLTVTQNGEPVAMVVPFRQPEPAVPAGGHATGEDPV